MINLLCGSVREKDEKMQKNLHILGTEIWKTNTSVPKRGCPLLVLDKVLRSEDSETLDWVCKVLPIKEKVARTVKIYEILEKLVTYIRGNEARSGYVQYVQGIQSNLPACTTFFFWMLWNQVAFILLFTSQLAALNNYLLCIGHNSENLWTDLDTSARTSILTL